MCMSIYTRESMQRMESLLWRAYTVKGIADYNAEQ